MQGPCRSSSAVCAVGVCYIEAKGHACVFREAPLSHMGLGSGSWTAEEKICLATRLALSWLRSARSGHGLADRGGIIAQPRCRLPVASDAASSLLRCAFFQVKSLLQASDVMSETVLHVASKGGNIGMWTAVVDVLKGEGLLEEVRVDYLFYRWCASLFCWKGSLQPRTYPAS